MSTQSEFASLARRIGRGLARVEREQVCCGDVTLQQFETLRVLHAEGALTTGALADRLGIDLSTASRNLALLERAGYVARARGKSDARHMTNALSRKGIRCVESLRCDERSVFDAVLARVPAAKRAGVLTALEHLAVALDGAQACADGACCPAPPAVLGRRASP